MLPSAQKPDTETALYAGAVVTCLVGLLPYVNVFLFPSYALGGIAAVWYAVSARRQSLTLKDGAKLGFYSTFLGSMAAIIIFDMIWQFFDYQLWQEQNAQLMLGLFRAFASPATIDVMTDAFAQNAAKSFAWYLIIIQLIANGIMAGIFGTLAGLITAKALRSRLPMPVEI